MKISIKNLITMGAALLLIIGIFSPLVSVPAVGSISFWSAGDYQGLSGVDTQFASILMIICAVIMIGLTVISMLIPSFKYPRITGIAAILILLIPLIMVLPGQIQAYHERMTSPTPGWLQSVGDAVSSAGANVGMKAVSFQWGLFVFAIALLACLVVGILKLLKKM